MTFQRDLAWQNLELQNRSSIAYQFARYSLGLNYELLPDNVVHQAKRCLLDALGCAIGAHDAPGLPICEAVIKELGGTEEATVIGSGLRTSAPNATLANSFMVRFLDYNDMGGGGHNTDSIPAILAVSEREKSGGKDFLTSLVLSYELGSRIAESATSSAWEKCGWSFDVRGGLSMPPTLGRLMKLDEDQIANAIGICACASLPLRVLDCDKEEFVMRKNLRFGWIAHDAIMACLFAKRGFTGPVRVVEGDGGFCEVILHSDMNLERMIDFSGWRILNTRHKYLCANGSSHGHIYATLAIVKEHDLNPEDIAAVRIRICGKEARHTTNLAKKYPRNAESADHSTFYTNAIAIKERAVGPESIDPKKFTDPIVLDLIEKITVEADPSIPDHTYEAISEITTKDGRKFQKRIVTPHGFGNDPLTDTELEEKFRGMATKYMTDRQIKQIFDTVWNLESLDNMGKLMKLMVFPSKE